MPIPVWASLQKLFTQAFMADPNSKQDQLPSAGSTTPDVVPDLRGDMTSMQGGQLQLRETGDVLDTNSAMNRIVRYREYERLRSMPEIEAVTDIIAEEACVAGETKIPTLAYGTRPISWLGKNYTEPFLTYCYDFEKEDITLGWAYDPRFVKRSETVKVLFDNGEYIIGTPDHRILKRDETWTTLGDLKLDDDLMPFYRFDHNKQLNKLRRNLYPRIFTFEHGWIHERQLIDQWRSGRHNKEYDRCNKAVRLFGEGLNKMRVAEIMGTYWECVEGWLRNHGFTAEESRWLGKKKDRRRVLGVFKHSTMDVYDMSVEKHENFCTDAGVIVHNCQLGDNGHVFEIHSKNEEIVDELNTLFFHRKMLNMDRRMWNIAKQTGVFGDHFMEQLIDPADPGKGILALKDLPPDNMYRIETNKQRLIEFQQASTANGPDYQAVVKCPIDKATEAEIMQCTCTRFAPQQIVHFKFGDDRKMFYPYGVSLIEPARAPAHQLRLMEDAVIVYRISRATERRIFYIDVGGLPQAKGLAFVETVKDHIRKKKIGTNRGTGANAVDAKYMAPPIDEDIFLPTRANSNTRIETLPGAQNLDQVADLSIFRDKMFMALHFPKDQWAPEDASATRMTVSARDAKFARYIERIQAHLVDGLYQIAERHLYLRGYPEEMYEDLRITMTPPSDYRRLGRLEVINGEVGIATSFKSAMLMADFDIFTRILHYSEEDTEEIIARNKIQKYEDAKLQIVMQNPQLLGVGVPGPGETEISADAEGPSPMLGPEGAEQPPEGAEGMPPEGGMGMGSNGASAGEGHQPLPEPDMENIKRFNLEIKSYEKDQDREDIDWSTLG